jgi:hypothetical protein
LQEQQPDISNPDELTDRIMDSLPDLTPEQPKPARRIRLYIASAIAVAASVLLLLTLHSLVGEEQGVGSVTSSLSTKKGRDGTLERGAKLQTPPPTPPLDGRGVAALPGSRQGVPTSVEALQIEYAQQTKRVQQAEPLNEVLTERDIPITRPENYKYTPEEIALMKKQAREAYLKWVELELEIAKYNQEQTANNYRDL